MFGVPSPWTQGHLAPKAAVILDYAYRPLSIQEGSTRYTLVSQQLFLHLDASLALFDRVLISLDMPFALAQGGESPTVYGVSLASPSGAQVGDLRIGARVRIFGEPDDPFQIAAGGYLYAPTGPDGSYAGDGSVRGAPQIVVGGRYGRFLYNASLGTTLRASSHAHTFDARIGAAALLGRDDFVQVGPELSIAAPFSNDALVSTTNAQIALASPTSAELLLGAKLRFLSFLVVGAGAGPGLSQGYGTPVFFAVGSIGYEPRTPRPGEQDTDGDGIVDAVDACVNLRGVKSDVPSKNGCPPDRDGDSIVDAEDACPDVSGVKSDDPKKNGCPLDSDSDGIFDPADACPKVPGAKSDDPKKNGCPPDADGDGIFDAVDACPKEPGAKSEDPKKHGCPGDRDDDGVPDAVDACPDVRGGPDTDPAQHGCPHVTVTQNEIIIKRQVKFRIAQATLGQTVDPVSDDLLTEVRNAIVDHPEIQLIEVQGHADNTGPEEFNQRLSQGRADAVRLWLIQRGIARTKLIAKGYGSTVPVASNDTEEGRQANRRVQFVIIQKKAP
jgi:outer membrane protein OmpA-like peptidoglycan-associated protein